MHWNFSTDRNAFLIRVVREIRGFSFGTRVKLFAAALILVSARNALADVHYVDVNSTNATPPYSSWATAATNIQDAVDAAVAGDEIVVTNGVYNTGGRNGSRVSVDEALIIRSVNGPQSTTIFGSSGLQWIRCVYLTNGASLSGFTLTHGSSRGGGGGVLSGGAVVSNCVVSGNSAFREGGGVAGGTLNNCTIAGNTSGKILGAGSADAYGGGAAFCTLNNCTLTSNSAKGDLESLGGGAYLCILKNCTLAGNSAHTSDFRARGGGAYQSSLYNCILLYNTSDSGCGDCGSPGNLDPVYNNWFGDPLFVDTNGWADLRLQSNSPCINAGNNSYVTSATDFDGNPRIVGGTVDIGAYEFQAVRYVDVNSTNATPPYSSWATAAANIQDAVDAAVAGDEIVVTNGTYATGGRSTVSQSTTTNRVVVDKPLALRSVNGPQFTIIDGGRVFRCVYLTNGASLSGFTLTNGRSAYRGGGLLCDSTNAVVSNCVVSGNFAQPYSAIIYGDPAAGGGVYGGTLNNCVVSGNFAKHYPSLDGDAVGGGAYGCTLNNCTLSDNIARAYRESSLFNAYARGGGAYACTLNNCTLRSNSAYANNRNYNDTYSEGGGAYGCTLNNCTLSDNSAYADSRRPFYISGGGACNSALNNCTLTGNSAQRYGGGARGGTLNNCTLTGNSATNSGGGAYSSTLNNCVVYFNTAEQGANYSSSTLNCSCTTPLPANGLGNITNAPLFVDQASGNLRLQSNSPCINAGLNALAPAGPDLDGNPRIVGGTVDIGAYEFQAPASMISYAWLQQFNLPVDFLTDGADPDGDGVDNYHEWLAGTDPTNPFSFAPLLTLIPDGANVILTWPTNAVGFTLQSTTNLISPADWSTNSPAPIVIGGQNVVTNPITGPQQFYRLRH